MTWYIEGNRGKARGWDVVNRGNRITREIRQGNTNEIRKETIKLMW